MTGFHYVAIIIPSVGNANLSFIAIADKTNFLKVILTIIIIVAAFNYHNSYNHDHPPAQIQRSRASVS